MSPERGVWLVVVLLVTALAGWRWHEEQVNAPVRVPGIGGPAVIAVVQTGDCPDRRAALERWLTRLHSAPERPPIERWRLVLRGPDPSRGSVLASIRPLPEPAEEAANRAMLRSVARATPAVLVLGPDGVPLTVVHFDEKGPGPSLASAAATLSLLSDR